MSRLETKPMKSIRRLTLGCSKRLAWTMHHRIERVTLPEVVGWTISARSDAFRFRAVPGPPRMPSKIAETSNSGAVTIASSNITGFIAPHAIVWRFLVWQLMPSLRRSFVQISGFSYRC